MLPIGELERLRKDILYTLPDVCAIYAASRTTDSYGGVIETWSPVYEQVPCRFDQQQGREQSAGEGMQWFTTNSLSIPIEYPVTIDNRIVYKDAYYSISNISAGSGLAIRRLILERVI